MSNETADFSRFTPEAYGTGAKVQSEYTRMIFQRLGIDPESLRPTDYQDPATTRLLVDFYTDFGVEPQSNLGQLVHIIGLEKKLEGLVSGRRATGSGMIFTVENRALLERVHSATKQLGELVFGEAASAEIAGLRADFFLHREQSTHHDTAIRHRRDVVLRERVASIHARFPLTSRVRMDM